MEYDSVHWHDMEAAFDPLELMDTHSLQEQWKEGWSSQTLCQVNDCVVRLGVGHGKFHWHKHDNEDEFFFVIEGTLRIHLDERSVELGSGQAFTVPRQVMHRTEAVGRTVILMVEGKTVTPTGDV
ncbi:MAG: cupin domain-containing protein [Anaerolineales bacterium]|jgi:mannose-6-phosphate isomerase-like protein (cupin superfamily)